MWRWWQTQAAAVRRVTHREGGWENKGCSSLVWQPGLSSVRIIKDLSQVSAHHSHQQWIIDSDHVTPRVKPRHDQVRQLKHDHKRQQRQCLWKKERHLSITPRTGVRKRVSHVSRLWAATWASWKVLRNNTFSLCHMIIGWLVAAHHRASSPMGLSSPRSSLRYLWQNNIFHFFFFLAVFFPCLLSPRSASSWFSPTPRNSFKTGSRTCLKIMEFSVFGTNRHKGRSGHVGERQVLKETAQRPEH